MFRGRRSLRRAYRQENRGGFRHQVQQANELLDEGKYAEATGAFQKLAHDAEGAYLKRAPYLYLQAGQASILGGQTKSGVGFFKQGLTMLGTQGRFRRMQHAGDRIVDDLTSRGLSAEAAEITAFIKNNMTQQKFVEPTGPAKKPTLPTHCPSCGAAVRPDEVDWLDELTAECSYCGSPVRAEK
jgi:hypothetical protein